MLAYETAFPFSGSTAYLKPTGLQVRIIQHRRDGTALIQHTDLALNDAERASGNRTVPIADLVAKREEALPRRRRRRAA